MNKKDFGRLVRSLREDKRIPVKRKNGITKFGLMSQEKLADKIDSSRNTISHIETGNKANLHEEGLLQKLANAFELTSAERKEFFLAALEIEQTAYVKDDKQFLLDDLISDMEDMPTPAFINDCFGDIVAGNTFMSNFLSISKDYLDPNNLSPASFNIMNIICSENSGYKRIVDRYWERSLLGKIGYEKYAVFS